MALISVSIIDGPLEAPNVAWPDTDSGAVARFEGIVRPSEDGSTIDGLEYETYDPMTDRVLGELAERAVSRFGVDFLWVEHSRGFVPTARCSFRLTIGAMHRRECLDAMDWFIMRMKQDAPIWKHPRYAPAALHTSSGTSTRDARDGMS